MSYYRLYPSRNNTIFRYSLWSDTKNPVITGYSYDTVNSGANPVMELMDGKGESKILFSFDLSNSLLRKIVDYPNPSIKLQLWDAGTLWEPAINLQTLRLQTFDHNFSEGDGYAFFKPEAKEGVSNWLKADSVTPWTDVTFTDVLTYEMNRINEDFNFNIYSAVIDYINANYTQSGGFFNNTTGVSLNFALVLPNRTDDPKNIFRKFIHSIYTKTVFKPYIEFTFNDRMVDNTLSTYSGTSNRYYLVNKNGRPFNVKMNAKVTENGVTTGVDSEDVTSSVIYIDYTPDVVSTPYKKEFIKIQWVDGTNTVYQQQLIEVKNQIELTDSFDASNLFFYPTSPSTHNVVKQGDIIPMKVISEVRGSGPIVLNNYEYRVTSADGFEMVPWQPVSVYRDSMFFNLNTDFFYPEQQYEVMLRVNGGSYIWTSPQTHKFKLAMNDKSHLRDMSSSPYYSRNQNFSK